MFAGTRFERPVVKTSGSRAFSSEVGAGSREENATRQIAGATRRLRETVNCSRLIHLVRLSAVVLCFGILAPESRAAGECPREVSNPATPPQCDGQPKDKCCEFNSASQVYCFWQERWKKCERTAMIYKYQDVQEALQKLGFKTEVTGRLDDQTVKSLQKFGKDNGYPVSYTPDPDMLKQIIKQSGGEAPK